jgi:hypothetical protein
MESNDELFPDVLPPAGTEIVTVKTMNDSLSTMKDAVEEFDKIGASLALVEQQHPKGMKLDLKVPENLILAKAGYGAWREKRLAVEKARKGAKRPLIDLGKAVDGFAARLAEAANSGEKNYQGQIEAHQAELERLEQERIQRHENGIATIRNFVNAAKGLPAARIQLGIERLKAMKFGDDWQEYAHKAYTAQQETITALEGLHAQAKLDEQLALERERQKQEQEQQRKELEAKQAELDKQAAAIEKQQTAMGDMQQMQINVQAARESETTLEQIQEIIDGLAQWPVTEELFGTMVPVVQMAKDAALVQVREVYRLKDVAEQEALQKRVAEREAAAAPPAPAPQPADLPDDPFYDPFREKPVLVFGTGSGPAGSGEAAPAAAPAAAPVAAPVQAPAAADPAGEEATLNIGHMCARLGFQITAPFVIETLKLPPRSTERRAQLYYPSDFIIICDALVSHISLVREANS